MLWIMRLRGNNNNRLTSPSENRPARKEYNQLSSKEGFSSGKSYTPKRSDSFNESNNGNESCSESDSNCTDVDDSNDDHEGGQNRVSRKKEVEPDEVQNHTDMLNNNQSTNPTSKSCRRTRHYSREIVNDDSDYDEALTCNVCDRSFPTQRQLESHQQKKRHFGCSTCDSLYLSLMALEHHKEEFQHWSDEEEYCSVGYDSDSSEDTAPSEDCERLL
ncbi:uncharacterized protein LOC143910671 [Arctopsyche grandis]|uniref:uncharacterized protein LOC143910671 n=1 Tax=Arctopsyche grandis TaxID=121162 RepID=UPI00406D864E